MTRANTEQLKHTPWFAMAGEACSIAPISRVVGPNIFALKGEAISAEALLRLERGQVAELGSRKLLAILALLGMEIDFSTLTRYGSLDELRRERQGK